jgi:hypothetical protein
LALDADGKTIKNPTKQVQLIFNQGNLEQYFKWIKSLSSILTGQLVTEHYRLTLHSLRGTDRALWQHEWDIASPQLSSTAGINPEAAHTISFKSIRKLIDHVIKDARADYKQKHYMEIYICFPKNQPLYLPTFSPPIREKITNDVGL